MEVYLIKQQNTNLYKIGISKDPKTRLNQLQTANADTLQLISTFKTKHGFQLETFVQRKYSDANVQLEWFELTEAEVKQFIPVCKQGESNFDLLLENNTYLQDRYQKRVKKIIGHERRVRKTYVR